MAVCHPFVVGGERGLQSVSSAPHNGSNQHRSSRNVCSTSAPLLKKRTFYYLLPAVTIAVLINIPKFLEFRTVTRSVNWFGFTCFDSFAICFSHLAIFFSFFNAMLCVGSIQYMMLAGIDPMTSWLRLICLNH